MKDRADILLQKLGFAPSREKARAMIMAGQVFADNQRVEKAGILLSTAANIELKGEKMPFVSRGGLKLSKALESFSILLDSKTVVDIGASTGGFTDCALQKGAKLVYAIDVGYGQLDWSLRQDSRVVVMEKTNARYVELQDLGIPNGLDFATVDVSFISLDKIFPALVRLLAEWGEGVALIKPQFEAGRELVGKKGVVRDANVHINVIERLVSNLAIHGLYFYGLDFSPIRGPEGNIEYLLWFGKKDDQKIRLEKSCLSKEKTPSKIVTEAFGVFEPLLAKG